MTCPVPICQERVFASGKQVQLKRSDSVFVRCMQALKIHCMCVTLLSASSQLKTGSKATRRFRRRHEAALNQYANFTYGWHFIWNILQLVCTWLCIIAIIQQLKFDFVAYCKSRTT